MNQRCEIKQYAKDQRKKKYLQSHSKVVGSGRTDGFRKERRKNCGDEGVYEKLCPPVGYANKRRQAMCAGTTGSWKSLD